jgi:ubiquinone/menaquinone biosynthesis C-methylase UbiE
LRHRGAKNTFGDLFVKNTIVDYYSSYDEKNRLLERHSLERLRTQEIITRYLGKASGKILDIGGAAGVYSFWLANQGHSVDLIDITPKHIEQAKEYEVQSGIKLSSALVGDACELPFKNDYYDIVLLMGPMYHILDKDKRNQTLLEAKRVLNNKGTLFIAAISKYASMFDGFLENIVDDNDFYKIIIEDIDTGKHINTTSKPQYFTDSYFHHPEELKNEIVEAGLRIVDFLAVEGLGNYIPNVEIKLENDDYKEKLFTILRLTEKESTIMGISNHFLCVCNKE